MNFRACTASRRRDGVASSGPSDSVDRRIENRVTGAGARTDRRSLETIGLNGKGSRQPNRGRVTGSIRWTAQEDDQDRL
jgi:hypothetical protein